MREGWVSVIILLAMGLVLAWTLQAAGVAEGIDVLQIVMIVGTLAGIALARANVPDLVAHGASIILGSGCGLYVVSLLLPKEMAWMERWQSIQFRVNDWLFQAVSGGESYDSLMFILFTALLFWLFAYVAAYAVFKLRVVWLAIIPNGVVIMMNAYYNPKLLTYFVSYLLLSLLLILRYTLFEKEDEWQRERVRYNPDVGLDFLRDGAISAFLVIGLAWFFPLTVSDYREWKVWDVVDEPWQEVQFHWNRVFASLGGYGPPQFSFFADSLTLSGAVDLDETPVMQVTSPEKRYWRALTFDEYTGRGWNNTDPDEVELEPYAPEPIPMPYEGRKELSQIVSLFRPGERVIFAANQVAQVNMPANARLSFLPPETSGGAGAADGSAPAAEISILASTQRMRRDQTYEAVSWVSEAPPSELRGAGTDYPDWVRERYMQLPEGLPDSVPELAEQVSKDATNAFDKASTIERYLRQITYNEAIPAPPLGVDVVEWFLFEGKEGYCDYYSTAMAVMLRSIGIPARVARGYASGEYNEDYEAYIVRSLDAHAWPEVYFPKYGWIEFEPTASEELLVRPLEEDGTDSASIDPSLRGPLSQNPFEEEEYPYPDVPFGPLPTTPTSDPWWQRTDWLLNLLPVLPVLLGGYLIWRIRQRSRSAATLVTAAFDNMIDYASRLGVKLRPDQTPYECAAAIAAIMDEDTKDVRMITDLYVKQRYGRTEATVFDEMNAMDAWRRLRQTLRVYLILKRLPIKNETAQRLRAAVGAGA